MIERKIGIVGLGYVGIPLLYHFTKEGLDCIGYDIDHQKIHSLQNKNDPTREISSEALTNVNLSIGTDSEILNDVNFYIVTVPTPIDNEQNINLSPLKSACNIIGAKLKKSDIVVFESTVYPGCTEEFCVQILEAESGLKWGQDFSVGYSPERINPGDKSNSLQTTCKIYAGDCDATSNSIFSVYSKIIHAGLFKTKDIKTAEATKLTENIQRDVNIALVNELHHVYGKMGIDLFHVLEAAQTKWNFMPFKPGLVGGHCIGVDPYYLIQHAKNLGLDTPLIAEARRNNDRRLDRLFNDICDQTDHDQKILVMGATFKPDVPDTRNSKALELAESLSTKRNTFVMDPFIEPSDFSHLNVVDNFSQGPFDLLVYAVNHRFFSELYTTLDHSIKDDGTIFDVTGELKLPGNHNRQYIR